MLLKSLEMQGFGSYREYSKINFNVGITGIIGKQGNNPRKSNASGKTTIVMAILFVLYGDGKFDTMDEVWNDSLKKKEEAFVRLLFELNGIIYKVERGRKTLGSYLELHENDVRIGNSVTEAQNYINSLLGMNSKLFTASVFFKQGDLSAFMDASPAVKREYLDTILELDIWREGKKRISADIKSITQELELISEKIFKLKEEKNGTKDRINILVQSLANKDSLITTKDNLLQQLSSIQDNSAEIKTIETQIQLALKDIELNLDKIKNIDSKLEEDSQSVVALKIELKNCDIENIIDAVKTLEGYIVQKVQLEEELKALDQREKLLFGEVARLELQISQKISFKENLKSGKCGSCEQDVTQEYVIEKRTLLDSEIKQLQNLLQRTNKERDEIHHLISTTKEKSSLIGSKSVALSTKITTHDSLLRKLELLRKEVEERNKSLDEKKLELNNTVLVTNTKIEELKAQLDRARLSQDSAASTRKNEILNSLQSLDIKLQEMSRKEAELEISRKSLQTILQDIENIEKRLKELEENKYSLLVLEQAFQDIPTKLFQESIKSIEFYANELLQEILPKFSIKIFEDLDKKNRKIIIAFQENEKQRNFKMLSGGESSICAMSLRIGINKVIATKSNIGIRFLVLDEVFGALDEENRQLVMAALLKWRIHFSQIFIITHTDESEVLPQSIVVTKDFSGCSRII